MTLVIASISGEAIDLPDFQDENPFVIHNDAHYYVREKSRRVLHTYVADDYPCNLGKNFWYRVRKDDNGVIATSYPTAADPETYRPYRDCFQFRVDDCLLAGPSAKLAVTSDYTHQLIKGMWSTAVRYKITPTGISVFWNLGSYEKDTDLGSMWIRGWDFDFESNKTMFCEYSGYCSTRNGKIAEVDSVHFLNYLLEHAGDVQNLQSLPEPFRTFFSYDDENTCPWWFEVKSAWSEICPVTERGDYYPNLPGPTTVAGLDPTWIDIVLRRFNSDVLRSWSDFHLAHSEEYDLDRKCVQSFQLKDAKVLRECVDTATQFDGMKRLSELPKGVLPQLSFKKASKLLDYNSIFRLRQTSKELIKNICGLKLWYDYGVKLPLATVKKWVGRNGSYWRILRDGIQDVLRAGLTRGASAPDGTSVNSVVHRLYRIGPRGKAEMFYDQCYRHGLTMNLSDAWDLIPLSFAFDWCCGIINNTVSKITDSIDSWRFNYSYCCTSEKLDYTIPIGSTHISIHGYVRRYSNRHPNCDYHSDIEDMAGTFSVSSTADASALLIALWRS